MKKKKKIMDKTTNSRVYKQTRHIQDGFGCIICFKRSGGHNFGCGPWYPDRNTQRSWKSYRKKQWKE